MISLDIALLHLFDVEEKMLDHYRILLHDEDISIFTSIYLPQFYDPGSKQRVESQTLARLNLAAPPSYPLAYRSF